MAFVAPAADPTYEPLYVASNEYHSTADGNNMVLNTPAAAAGTDGVGDFLLFIAGTGTSNGVWTVPPGMTALTVGGEQVNMNSRVFYRICTGAEDSSYTSNLGYTYRRAGVFARYRRCNADSPIRVQDVVFTGSGTSQTACPTPNPLAGTTADDLIIRVFLASETSASGTQSITPTPLSNAGWSVRQSITNEGSTDEACCIVVADKVGAASTDRPVPTTNKTSNWVVYSLALRAAVSPAQQLGAWLLAA